MAGGDGECGRGEDDGGVLLKERAGEELRYVDGSCLQGDVMRGQCCCAAAFLCERPDALHGAAFDPEDGVGIARFEQELEVRGDVGGAFPEARNFLDIFDAFELRVEAVESVARAGVGVAGVFEELVAGGEVHAADEIGTRGQRGEEEARAFAQSGGSGVDAGRRGAFGAEHGLDVAGEFVESVQTERDAEVVAGDLFELVGLVEDDGGGGGQDAGIGYVARFEADGEVGEEEVVVDDDDLGLEGLAAHLGDEAALEVRAGLAEASLAARVELRPERGALGQAGDLGAVAGEGGLLPGGDGVELVDLVETRQNWCIA